MKSQLIKSVILNCLDEDALTRLNSDAVGVCVDLTYGYFSFSAMCFESFTGSYSKVKCVFTWRLVVWVVCRADKYSVGAIGIA